MTKIDYFKKATTWAGDTFGRLEVSKNRYQAAFLIALSLNVVALIVIGILSHYQTLVPLLIHHYENGITTVEPIRNEQAPINRAQVESDIVRYIQYRESYDISSFRTQFEYPLPKVAKPTNKKTEAAPKMVNTAYRFNGSPRLVPKHVFDDGKFTYFELDSLNIVPAIFAVDEISGKESVVNTRRDRKYLIVQRLAPQFTLRQGGLSASVFNVKEINRIALNRRPQ